MIQFFILILQGGSFEQEKGKRLFLKFLQLKQKREIKEQQKEQTSIDKEESNYNSKIEFKKEEIYYEPFEMSLKKEDFIQTEIIAKQEPQLIDYFQDEYNDPYLMEFNYFNDSFQFDNYFS
ncbi:hypothetical protein pb186bvf_014604 [Paramecium bursaria]